MQIIKRMILSDREPQLIAAVDPECSIRCSRLRVSVLHPVSMDRAFWEVQFAQVAVFGPSLPFSLSEADGEEDTAALSVFIHRPIFFTIKAPGWGTTTQGLFLLITDLVSTTSTKSMDMLGWQLILWWRDEKIHRERWRRQRRAEIMSRFSHPLTPEKEIAVDEQSRLVIRQGERKRVNESFV